MNNSAFLINEWEAPEASTLLSSPFKHTYLTKLSLAGALAILALTSTTAIPVNTGTTVINEFETRNVVVSEINQTRRKNVKTDFSFLTSKGFSDDDRIVEGAF